MSNLSFGLLGLPNVGKSTLFNKMSQKQVPAENYPFCTIDPNIGQFYVRDPMVDELQQICSSESKLYAHIKCIDVAGLVQGASQGLGMGNAFLSHLRGCGCIVHVVRGFGDDVDPLRDISIIHDEIFLSDMGLIEKNKKLSAEDRMILSLLEEEKLLTGIKSGYDLISQKPFVFVLNVEKEEDGPSLAQAIAARYNRPVFVTARDRNNLWQLGNLVLEALDYITFYTCGKKESRSWITKRDSTIQEASSAIHTSFPQRFVKAQSIKISALREIKDAFDWGQEHKSFLGLENKKYVVKKGDILRFILRN